MVLEKQRAWVNSHTRNIGAKLTPQSVKDKFGGDLGDVLTADLNTIPRVGAAIGALAPGYIAFQVLPHIDSAYKFSEIAPEIVPQLERLAISASVYINPLTMPAVAAYAGLGFGAGKLVQMAIKGIYTPRTPESSSTLE
jgi:hypothetical protein